jgi:transcription elongation factor GreB
MSERPNFITPEGYRALREEYDALFAGERPQLLETIAWAAANGDRSENGDYIYGRKRLREIDRRISHLSRIMKAAKVVDPSTQPSRDQVRFGAKVELADEDDNRRIVTIVRFRGRSSAQGSATSGSCDCPWARKATRYSRSATRTEISSARRP